MDRRDTYIQIGANAILNSLDEEESKMFEAMYGIAPEDVDIEDLRYKCNPEFWDVLANIDKGGIFEINSPADWGREYFDMDEISYEEIDRFFKYNEFGKWCKENVSECILEKIHLLDYAVNDADIAVGYIAWLNSYNEPDWYSLFDKHPEAIECIDFEAFGKMCLDSDSAIINHNGEYFYCAHYDGEIGEALEDQTLRCVARNQEAER